VDRRQWRSRRRGWTVYETEVLSVFQGRGRGGEGEGEGEAEEARAGAGGRRGGIYVHMRRPVFLQSM
jgi:hypothetical protein